MGVKGQKKVMYVVLYNLGTMHHMIVIYGTHL